MSYYNTQYLRRFLNIQRGGPRALQAAAQLMGCDYQLRGLPGIGPKQAMALVKFLVNGREVRMVSRDGGV